MRPAKVEKQGQTKMFWYLEVALYQSCKNNERKEKGEKVSLQIYTLAHSTHFA